MIEDQLRPYFCRLALALYIDHAPLAKIELPNYCRLFERIDTKFLEINLDKEDPETNKRKIMFEKLTKEIEHYF